MEVFEVEQTLSFHSHEHGNYLQVPRFKRLRHTNVVEQASHFWRKEMPFNGMLERVCYDVRGDPKWTHSG